MRGRADALRYLQQACSAINRWAASGEDVSSTTMDLREPWSSLKTGVAKAGPQLGEVLAEVTDDYRPIVLFIAEFPATKRMYVNQAESILEKLVLIPEVDGLIKADPALRAKLCALGERACAALGEKKEEKEEKEEKREEKQEKKEEAVEAAAAVVEEAPAPFEPPHRPVAQDASPETPPEPRRSEPELPGANGPFEPFRPTLSQERFEVAPSAEQLAEAASAEAEAASAEAVWAAQAAAAAEETRRMLRDIFTAIAAADYEPLDAVGSSEAATQLFMQLYTAVNRAHWEQQRRTRPAAPSGDQQGAASEGAADSAWGGASEERPDILAEALTAGPWDPRRVLMFLLNLAKVRPLYRRRIECTAQMLMQVSPACRDVARGDAFLTAKLGPTQEQGRPVDVVSYAFASMLRWSCWDAAWHWVYTRHGRESQAAHHLQEWIRREQALKELAELPSEALGKLLLAAWKAAQHTVFERYPEEPRGLGAWLKGAIWRQEDKSVHKDEFFALFEAQKASGVFAESLHADLHWMMWNMAWYVANKSKNFSGQARAVLVRAERHLQRAFRGEAQWRGVNLGGWFVLEQGPSGPMWDNLPPVAEAATCEWTCCEALGPAQAKRLLDEHRRTYFTKRDFEEIRAAGLTHVRLPFGAWCIAGPRPGEPYVGPCLPDIDRAVDLIEGEGLRVVLDLHGAVGGESGERPCGHEDKGWKVGHWDFQASLAALRTVCERYAGRACVCGVGVCNEPATSVPAGVLGRYYEAAIETVRLAGMRAGEVTVLLPIFTELRTSEFLDLWEANYPKYEDCAFDLHLYQCFGAYWNLKGLSSHMAAAKDRATLLRGMPMCCVSEWSVALPLGVTKDYSEHEFRNVIKKFAQLQLEAFETATHGWFFWTWKDSAGIVWNMQKCIEDGVLRVPGGGRSTDLINP